MRWRRNSIDDITEVISDDGFAAISVATIATRPDTCARLKRQAVDVREEEQGLG